MINYQLITANNFHVKIILITVAYGIATKLQFPLKIVDKIY
jgi:hypothetical protein